jgi:putative ABC transport system permease protein
MSRLRIFFHRLFGLFLRRKVERELEEEIRSHLEMQIEDNLRQGLSPEDARRAARLKFGGVEQVKEAYWDKSRLGWMENLWQDLRYGVRTLLKTPGFTFIIIITLALGIGANTAVFSVVNAVLLRPYPYPDQDRIMWVWETKPPDIPRANPAPGNFLDWQKQNTVFERLAAVTIVDFNLTNTGNPQRVRGVRVGDGFLAMMGIRPEIGRDFLPDEDEPGHDNVVILGYKLWQKQFGGDPNVLNRTITLDDQSYTVVGVLPVNSGLRIGDMDVWLPIAFVGDRAQQRSNRYLNVIGRLKPGVTLEQAHSEMDAIADRLVKLYPDSNAGWKVRVVPLIEDVNGEHKPMLLLLLGAVTFVLLIACANVANLLLARAADRQKEIIVRIALGASRWRIIRQLLTESVLLSMAGGVLGSVLAFYGVKTLLAMSALNDFGPRVLDFSLDGRMLVFTIAVALLTGLSFGIAPAWQASKPNMNELLKDAGRGSTDGRLRRQVRSTLVVFEIAMALVLLVGAGLMIRSLIRMQQVDLGFNQNQTLTVSISLPRQKYPEKDQQVAFFRRLIERAAALPGVQTVGAACVVPFSAGHWGNFEEAIRVQGQGFKIEGRIYDQSGGVPYTDYSAVSPDYFKAMGIPLLRGRFFTEHDAKGASRVAIINNTLAKKFFPDEDPIGKRIQLSNEPDVDREIVGIVGDVKRVSLTREVPAQTYEPYLQQPFPFMTLALRTAGDPTLLNETIRREVLNLDREQPISGIITLDRLIANSTAEQRFLTLLLWSFATVALVLAAVGIYGVMSYIVLQRRREWGIRMALGAQGADVLKLVIKQAMAQAMSGILIGLVGARALTRLMTSVLYGVSATDAGTFLITSVLVSLVALLAVWVPARRAMKVDPLITLKYE